MDKYYRLSAFFIAAFYISTANAEGWTVNGENYAHPIKAIKIQIYDNATDKCFTNIAEAKNRIKVLLNQSNLKVISENSIDNSSENTWFDISVDARRTQNKLCYGMINVRATQWVEHNGGTLFIYIFNQNSYAIHHRDFNNFVIEVIQESFDEFYLAAKKHDLIK